MLENRGIVMNNTAFHQGKAMQKMIKNAGHTLFYLRPYYTDLNPVEKQRAHAKQMRRSTHC
ncbi:transposase [Holospora curviuscula]|nr:transposase [Holospora curviuscula]